MNFNQKEQDFNEQHRMRMAAARIIVGNLNHKITKGDFEDKFGKYGKVLDIEMHKTFAYVQFEREDDSIQALKNENGTLFKGTRLEITHEMDQNAQRPGGFPRNARSPPPPGGNRFGGPGFARDRSPIRDQNYDGGFREPYKKDERFFPRPEGFSDEFRKFPPGRRFEEEPYPYRFEPKEEMMRDRNYMPGGGAAAAGFPREDFGVVPKCNDCEIIVLNKQHREYAESVERRLKSLGLTVDLMFLCDEIVLVRTIRDLARNGTLYAIVIGRQHEMHLSVTLNILHDNPQEHRNMPLEDALKLVARNYQEYVQKKRERVAALDRGTNATLPPVNREIQLILNTLADNKYVTLSELEKVIMNLQERRELMKAAEAPKPPLKDEISNAEQKDLQQRILSIINQSGGDVAQNALQAPTPAPLPVPPPPVASMVQQQASPSPFLNLDNPNVQKALDSLIQSGPNLLKNISFATSLPSANNAPPIPQSHQHQRQDMNRPNQFGSGPGAGQPMRHPLLGTQVGGANNNYYGQRGSR